MAASADVSAISASVLPLRLVKADSLWQNARATQDFNYTPKCATLRGLLKMQTARFAPLSEDKNRTPEIKIAWVEACNGTATIETNVWVRGIPCDFSGWLVGTNSMTIKLRQRVKTSFNIPTQVFDNLFTVDELLAKGLAKAQKVLAEKLNDVAVAKLVAYSGLNKYQETDDLGQDGGSGGTSWKITKLPWDNSYAEALNPYFQKVEDENNLSGAKLFTGGVLSLSEYINNDNKDEFKFGDMSVVQDRRGFIANSVKSNMFLVANGAIALITTNNAPAAAVTNFENVTSVARPLLDLRDANGAPVLYDMYVKRVRRNVNQDDHSTDYNVTGRCEYMDNYYMEIHYEFVLNPTACSDGTTGVVRFDVDRTLDYVSSPARPVRTKAYV